MNSQLTGLNDKDEAAHGIRFPARAWNRGFEVKPSTIEVINNNTRFQALPGIDRPWINALIFWLCQ